MHLEMRLHEEPHPFLFADVARSDGSISQGSECGKLRACSVILLQELRLRKRLTLGVPDNRAVPAAETVAVAATRP